MRKTKICKGCFNRFIPGSGRLAYCSKRCERIVSWEWQEARLLDTGASDERLKIHRRHHPKYRSRKTLMGSDALDMSAYLETMRELRVDRMKASRSDSINLDDLIKRDKGVCYLCGGKVSKRGRLRDGVKWFEDPRYPTVDHVIPLSRDGSHTWDNVKLAHLECNRSKGGRIESEIRA